jgi:uncharacterized protein
LLELAVLALSLCVTHLVQGITGFGSIVLALPVLTFFYELDVLIPALIFINLLQAIWFAVTQRKFINWPHAKKLIVYSGVGLPIGYAVYKYLPAEQLKIALGVFVVIVAVWNLSGIAEKKDMPKPFYLFLIFLGGIAQSALACGGPFLVIYAAKMLPDKSEFRATLNVLWIILNALLCITYTINGEWKMEMVPIIAVGLPCVVFGTIVGIYAHEKIPQRPFSLSVFIILLISGLILLRPLLGI